MSDHWPPRKIIRDVLRCAHRATDQLGGLIAGHYRVVPYVEKSAIQYIINVSITRCGVAATTALIIIWGENTYVQYRTAAEGLMAGRSMLKLLKG